MACLKDEACNHVVETIEQHVDVFLKFFDSCAVVFNLLHHFAVVPPCGFAFGKLSVLVDVFVHLLDACEIRVDFVKSLDGIFVEFVFVVFCELKKIFESELVADDELTLIYEILEFSAIFPAAVLEPFAEVAYFFDKT